MATLLSYAIVSDPDPLQIGATGRLRVIGSNSSRTDSVVVKSLKIVLSVGENQFDLTNTPGSIAVRVERSSDWSIGRDGGAFTLSRNQPAVVEALEIVLSSIAVNNLAGRTTVRIYETARLSDESEWRVETRYDIEVWKQSQQLWIRNFRGTPAEIRAVGSTTLTWEASPRATLKLRFDKDGSGVKEVDVTNAGGAYRVEGITQHPRMRCDLIAYLDGNEFPASTTIDVGRRLPRIVDFHGERRDGALYVSWRTVFASRCTITGRSEFYAPSASDVRIDDNIAFVRLAAYNAADESVRRDLFDYVESGEARTAKPLPWTPELGCSRDGSSVYFNDAADASPSAAQVFHIGPADGFPTRTARQVANGLAFRADGTRYATIDGNGLKIFSASHQELRRRYFSYRRLIRAEFAPDHWALLVGAFADGPEERGDVIDGYDATGENRIGARDVGPLRHVSRERRFYVNHHSDGIRSLVWDGGASQTISFGAGVAAIATDHRERAYAVLRDLNEVAVFDGRRAGDGIQRRIRVGRAPTGLAVTQREVLVANSGDPFLSVIDIETQAVVETIPMPEPMCAVVFVPKYGMIFTYAAARDRVVRFTGTVLSLPGTKAAPRPLACRIEHSPNPIQAGQPATLFAIVTNESDAPAECKRVSVNGTLLGADAPIRPGGEIVFPWRFDAPADVGPMNVDVLIDDASHSFRADVFPAGFVIDQFEAVPEEVPPNGRATLVWRASGPRSEEARFTIAAPGMNEVAVGAEGLHSIDVTAAKTSVVLRAELDGIVTERTAVIRMKE